MKKIALFGLCLGLMGCATTGGISRVADLSPLGLVSVTSNPEIGWYGEGKKSAGLIGDLVKKAVSDKVGQTASALLPQAETMVVEALAKTGVAVVDKAKVINDSGYLGAKEDKLLAASGLVAAEGYRFVGTKDPAMMKALVGSTGLKTGLYLQFTFSKRLMTGVQNSGVAGATAEIMVTFVDASGKPVLQKLYYGASKGTFPIVAGVYEPAKLMALYPEAIAAACDKLVKDLGKK